jgi:hypothetical protein
MTTLEKLSATDAQAILDRLPTRIKAALLDRATAIEYPIEMVAEMAIASFLEFRSIRLSRLQTRTWAISLLG